MAGGGKAYGYGRCSALCQHPGCWYAEANLPPARKRPSEYSHYLDRLATRRRLVGEKEVPVNPLTRSHTADGLPTLKVQTLNHNGIGDHAHSVSLPTHAHLQRRRGPHRSSSSSISRPSGSVAGIRRVNYAQVSLEEDGDECGVVDDLSGMTFKPVLIWKPGQRSSPPSHGPTDARQKVAWRGPEQLPELVQGHEEGGVGDDAPVTSTEEKMCGSREGGREGGRNSVPLCKTNLTDTLPPTLSRAHPVKVATMHKNRVPRRFCSPDTMSLSYLGDIDLPPQVVREILQQLRSGSTHDTSELETQHSAKSTTSQHSHHHKSRTTPPAPPLWDGPTPHAPTSFSYDLTTRRIMNLSASRLAHATRLLSSGVSSFSRKLSTHPVEVLKNQSVFWGGRLPHEETGDRDVTACKFPKLTDISVEVVGGVLTAGLAGHSNRQQVGPTDSLQATGRTTCLHTRLTTQPRPLPPPAPPPPEPPSEGRCALTAIRIPATYDAPAAGHVAGRSNYTLPATTTVLLQLGSDWGPSPRLRPSPRSLHVQLPKSRHSEHHQHHAPPTTASPSSRPHTQEVADIAAERNIPLVAHGCPEWTQPRPHKPSRPLPRLKLHHRASKSPDYMLVGAKFTEGHLILTDEEGVVVQKLPESESEANLGSGQFSAGNGVAVTESAEHVTPPPLNPVGRTQVGGGDATEGGVVMGEWPEEEEEEDDNVAATQICGEDGLDHPVVGGQGPGGVPAGIRAPPPSAATEDCSEGQGRSAGIRTPPLSAVEEQDGIMNS